MATQQNQATRAPDPLRPRSNSHAPGGAWTNLSCREEFALNPTNALDSTTFLTQDVSARQRMENEFARTIVSAILEAF